MVAISIGDFVKVNCPTNEYSKGEIGRVCKIYFVSGKKYVKFENKKNSINETKVTKIQ